MGEKDRFHPDGDVLWVAGLEQHVVGIPHKKPRIHKRGNGGKNYFNQLMIYQGLNLVFQLWFILLRHIFGRWKDNMNARNFYSFTHFQEYFPCATRKLSFSVEIFPYIHFFKWLQSWWIYRALTSVIAYQTLFFFTISRNWEEFGGWSWKDITKFSMTVLAGFAQWIALEGFAFSQGNIPRFAGSIPGFGQGYL